jgi:hypothetical protein
MSDTATTVSVETPSTWTLDRIFTAAAPEFRRYIPIALSNDQLARLVDSRWRDPDRSWYTEEFLAELAKETGFDRAEKHRIPPRSEWGSIGDGSTSCPTCGGGGTYLAGHRGRVTGIEIVQRVPCVCRALKTFDRHWAEMRRVHKRFADVTLGGLRPNEELSSLPLARQAEIIARLKESPTDSYFIFGEPNTGKTHFAVALYRHSLFKWALQQWERGNPQPAVWRMTTSKMLDEHVAWERRDKTDENASVKPPTITAPKIQAAARNWYRPCLFLDEIDKIIPTDFKIQRLMQIVDAVYEAEGQVVATSNKSVDHLASKWGSDEAGTVLRRIGVGSNAHTLLFA